MILQKDKASLDSATDIRNGGTAVLQPDMCVMQLWDPLQVLTEVLLTLYSPDLCTTGIPHPAGIVTRSPDNPGDSGQWCETGVVYGSGLGL